MRRIRLHIRPLLRPVEDVIRRVMHQNAAQPFGFLGKHAWRRAVDRHGQLRLALRLIHRRISSRIHNHRRLSRSHRLANRIGTARNPPPDNQPPVTSPRQASRWRNSHPTCPSRPKTNIFRFLIAFLRVKNRHLQHFPTHPRYGYSFAVTISGLRLARGDNQLLQLLAQFAGLFPVLFSSRQVHQLLGIVALVVHLVLVIIRARRRYGRSRRVRHAIGPVHGANGAAGHRFADLDQLLVRPRFAQPWRRATAA